jgi:FtsH-binding integral membrane protein
MADYLKDLSAPVPNDRLGFVRKVYALTLLQLAFTTISVGLSISSTALQTYLYTSSVPYILGVLLTFAPLLAITFSPKLAREVPTNFAILAAFTVGQSITVAFTCIHYTPSSVLTAAVMTLIMTAGLTAYAWTTPRDYSVKTGILLVLLKALIMFTLIFLFFSRSRALELLVSLAFTVIFSIYIVVDTQIILGNKKLALSYDDYIIGSLTLYTDIISLFLRLVQLLGDKKEKQRSS